MEAARVRAYKAVFIQQLVSVQSSCEFNGNINEKWLIIRLLDVLALLLLISKNQLDNLESSVEKHIFLLFNILSRVSAVWHGKLQLLQVGIRRDLRVPQRWKGEDCDGQDEFPLCSLHPWIQSCNPYKIYYWCDLYTFYSSCESRYENRFLWWSSLTCTSHLPRQPLLPLPNCSLDCRTAFQILLYFP